MPGFWRWPRYSFICSLCDMMQQDLLERHFWINEKRWNECFKAKDFRWDTCNETHSKAGAWTEQRSLIESAAPFSEMNRNWRAWIILFPTDYHKFGTVGVLGARQIWKIEEDHWMSSWPRPTGRDRLCGVKQENSVDETALNSSWTRLREFIRSWDVYWQGAEIGKPWRCPWGALMQPTSSQSMTCLNRN